MDSTVIKAQAVKFNKARNNLLAVVAFTVINLFLIAFDFDLSFLFSAFVPQILQIIVHEFFSMSIGLIIGLAFTSVYLVCYALSKRWRVFILIALLLFLIDALIMLGAMFITGAYGEFIFNIAFHAWILFYLITGTVAWVKLGKVTADEFKEIQQEVVQTEQTEELNSALHTVASTSAISDTLPQDIDRLENSGMYVIDDYMKNSIFALYSQTEKLYLFEDIPHQKLENAKNSYASMIGDDETIIFLYDDTVRGSANEGFILTTKCLYSKNYGASGEAAYIPNINEICVPKFGIISSHIIVKLATRSDIEIHITRPKSQAEAVFNTLNQTVDLLKNQVRLVQ